MNKYRSNRNHLIWIFFLVVIVVLLLVKEEYPQIVNMLILMSNIITFTIIINLESYTVLNFKEDMVVVKVSRNQKKNIKYNDITNVYNYQDKVIEIEVNNRRYFAVPLYRIESQFHEEIKIKFKKIIRTQKAKKKAERSNLLADWDKINMFYNSGRKKYAIECGKTFIRNIQNEYPPNSLLLASSLITMANLYKDQNNYKEAETLLRQAFSIREKC